MIQVDDRKAYVANLPFDVTASEVCFIRFMVNHDCFDRLLRLQVRDEFERFGEITEVQLRTIPLYPRPEWCVVKLVLE